MFWLFIKRVFEDEAYLWRDRGRYTTLMLVFFLGEKTNKTDV